jgi:hypothetical protein
LRYEVHSNPKATIAALCLQLAPVLVASQVEQFLARKLAVVVEVTFFEL